MGYGLPAFDVKVSVEGCYVFCGGELGRSTQYPRASKLLRLSNSYSNPCYYFQHLAQGVQIQDVPLSALLLCRCIVWCLQDAEMQKMVQEYIAKLAKLSVIWK